MTLATVKEKLHQYIECADAKKAHAMFSILENELSEPDYVFDQATLDMLNERWEHYLCGKSKSYTLAESMENIRTHRMKNGL